MKDADPVFLSFLFEGGTETVQFPAHIDRPHLRVVISDHLHQFNPVLAGHVEVRKDEVRFESKVGPKRVTAVFCRPDLVSRVLQNNFENRGQFLVVVNDEDLRNGYTPNNRMNPPAFLEQELCQALTEEPAKKIDWN